MASGLEKTKAEPLGLTFGLDLLRLYELAADAYFAEGQDARALEYVPFIVRHGQKLSDLFRLYYLSEVSNAKLVAKFLDVGRINVIITRLRAALQRPRCSLLTCFASSFSEHTSDLCRSSSFY